MHATPASLDPTTLSRSQPSNCVRRSVAEPGRVRQATRSYPWRLDGDYDTLISIMNVSGSPAQFHARLNYSGGVYWFKTLELLPGRSATFDLRTIRDIRIADVKGVLLPQTVQGGQFRWSIVEAGGQTKLNGRAEISSLLAARNTKLQLSGLLPGQWW